MTEIEHWIVAGRPPASPGSTLFRRDRLAAYLQSHRDTSGVCWVYPRDGSRVAVSTSDTGLRTVGIPRGLGMLHYGPRAPLGLLLRSVSSSSNGRRVLWFTHPSFPGLMRSRPWNAIVYDCSDLWSEWGGFGSSTGLRARAGERLLSAAEVRIATRATHVVVSSPFLGTRLRDRVGRDPNAVVENGVDFAMFASAGREAISREDRRFVFAGGLKPKLDFSLFERLATEIPSATIVLAGPVGSSVRTAFDRLTRLPNVTYVGRVAPEDVPRLLATAKVGLLPYLPTDYNRAVSPLKLFEYLAVGIPVVGTGLPATARYHRPGAYFHASDPDAFITECRRLIEHELTPEDQAICRAEAAGHDWRPKFEAIYDLVVEGTAIDA